MKVLDVNAWGINLWGLVIPWAAIIPLAFLLLFLITGQMPARGSLKTISRKENPFSYWFGCSILALATLIFTLILNPSLLVKVLNLIH